MAIPARCGDLRPHGPHIYMGPSPKPGETKQVEYRCPGETGRDTVKKPKRK